MKLQYKELIKEVIYAEEDYEQIYIDVVNLVKNLGYKPKDFKAMIRSIRYDNCPDIIDESHEYYDMLCDVCDKYDIRWWLFEVKND